MSALPPMDVLSASSKGKRTLIETLDAWADRRPDKVHAYVLRDADVSKGFDAVTHRQIRDAADAFAWWLRETYGEHKDFPTVAYVGLNDLRYTIVYYGAIKAGYKSLFVSPRNPPAQNASLLEQTSCRHFLHSPGLAAVVQAVIPLVPFPVSAAEIKPLEHWLERSSRPFKFEKTFDEAKWDPVVVMHSSGSTGLPKPITLNHGYFAASEAAMRPIADRITAGPPMFDFTGGGSFFSPFPPYHLAGLQSMSNLPVIAFEASVILGLPDRPPSPQLIHDVLKSKSPKALYSPPSLIEAISQLPDGLDLLSNCECIIYAGGPLSKSCGDILTKTVRLSTVYGSTETGSNHILLTPSEDWDYLEFHPDFHRRMEPTVDGAYELIFSQEDPYPETRGISWSLPHATEYRTRDMFMPHPAKPNLWKFHGRNDDIIVFSNGAKYNPIPAENIILGSPLLSGVLILGDGREQAAVLLEPKESPTSSADLIKGVMPFIDRANAQCQKQGRILRSKIAVVEPAGLIRAPKGTVVRTLSRNKFSKLIGDLYSNTSTDAGVDSALPVLKIPDAISNALVEYVRDCVHCSTTLESIRDDEDFYVYGLDSVQTVDFVRVLRAGLAAQYGDCSWVNARLVFDHPSISRLAFALSNKLAFGQVNGPRSSISQPQTSVDRLRSLIAKYVGLVAASNKPRIQAAKADNGGLHVVLTGSTGSLGIRLLSSLASEPTISKITCLDRGSDAKTRVSAASPNLSLQKVDFLQARFGDADLGLEAEKYQQLAATVEAVIHNAWKVDFNHSIESFEPVHLQGLVNLISLASQCSAPARLFFVSSVAAVSNWSEVDGKQSQAPERVAEDPAVAAASGYGQSKFVGENILARACAQAQGDMPVTILRVGQIAGPVDSSVVSPVWNPSEWVPAMLYTSKQLGFLPGWLPDVDWIPVDLLADVISEILVHDVALLRDALGEVEVYNIVNPGRTQWSTLVPAVQNRLNSAGRCEVISLRDWVAKLKELDASDKATLQRFPALKIVEFYENLLNTHKADGSAELAVTKGSNVSKTMAGLKAVDTAWLEIWMDQWQL